MRLVAAMVLVLALPSCRSGSGGDRADAGKLDGGSQLGWPCDIDADCAAGVCAHGTDVCTELSQLRQVKLTWTLRGAPPSASTCATSPQLAVRFVDPGIDFVGFSPVPCELGQFVMIHLPFAYREAEVSRDGGGGEVRHPIPSTNEVAFDLQL